MSDAPHEPETAPSETTEATSTADRSDLPDLPDLDAVQTKIDEAHQAEDHLVDVMPGAIDPAAEDETIVQAEGTDRS